MKKMVCLVLALLLCLNAAALAEYVPSKTTGDFTQIEATGENLPRKTRAWRFGLYCRMRKSIRIC